ncbi:multifunctional oxoglutarate decarboxylase/oxoglutarate dehydrogenase thiamine pyrophosphate-binding subunit/dihydrolipoyllysine-residue succinyltransferase subunit [Balneolales bacterium ANBcel1]|nr:multifunctional oxoglutarate decarboxylase/oxoglutarate dehydrogenase thiamine pyrophosphate-binding subunit/dihydrolipoyllysine-residue succinyltransferase subunit [Balneolales bacterium ANBcel1]
MKKIEAQFGPNAALVEDLYDQYLENPESVPEYWRTYFDELESESGPESAATEGTADPATGKKTPSEPSDLPKRPKNDKAPAADQKTSAKSGAREKTDQRGDDTESESEDFEYKPLKGVAVKLAENMSQSLEVPTATSLRVIPVKMLMEDRRIINSYLEKRLQPKATLTHFIAWAIIAALKDFPQLNHHFGEKGGKPARVVPGSVNLGIAIDLPNKDGSRNLVVPNIKKVDTMTFREFLEAYHELVNRARNGELEIDDYLGTTISITNPGTIGTVSSMPRLMRGQGAIIATGAINYPAEFQSMSQDLLSHLGISRVMNITCTYDHRIIQGAESGSFLARIQELLSGPTEFYESIFDELDIPYEPIPYGTDQYIGALDGGSDKEISDKKAVAVSRLIDRYRRHGHVMAELNPLKFGTGYNPELDFHYHGLTVWDLDRKFYPSKLGGSEQVTTLRNIIDILRNTYCGHIGAQYTHILEVEERSWLRDTMESTMNNPGLNKEEKRRILRKLNQASAFEEFLHKKYIGHKRFSLEGADTVIPMIDYLLERAATYAVSDVVLGMAHRGRLNVLVNTLNKSYQKVFAEFEGNIDPESAMGTGDVKYHLGAKSVHKAENGNEIKLLLMPNPSHLESVNPVVEGAVRALQDQSDDEQADKKVIPLLIHGDAAFAGQGVVAETLNMSQLEGFSTGGTIHLIINNQIGFTTLPKDGRSTEYASDLAKMILAPIFHVNGDEPEAAIQSIKLALDYRQKFGKDVVIDLICYRKHGHNEGDEPGFTQPSLYKEIYDHPSVRERYTNELVRRKELTKEETQQIFEEFDELLESAFKDARKAKNEGTSPVEIVRRHEKKQEEWSKDLPDTRFDMERLKEIGTKLNTLPPDFDGNPKLLRILAKRNEIVEKNLKKIDWGFAEALAFGSLLVEERPVRLSGQDSERGTFSHRHSVLHGTERQQTFVPLNNLQDNQATFKVFNSLLSEFAVLGFEFGYSSLRPQALVLWEAQFGDFNNGAQIIIDQYIAASESKWRQTSGIVMLLPHGYEGQGPEHSSARLERFLQLSANDNIQVANCTTPAQYYHLLRRQALRSDNKPLVIMAPKSLLRHSKVVASIEELADGRFQEVISDQRMKSASDAEKLILCSGKVYYDLMDMVEAEQIDDVAVARVEQFYPFPDRDIASLIASHENAEQVVWCQEEPRNMGGWQFMQDRLRPLLREGQELVYSGRAASASPATGSTSLHAFEQEQLVREALGVTAGKAKSTA